jgi:putative DNA primase/helicase
MELWQQSVPLQDTLGWRYFIERRGLHIGSLDLDHVLRWNESVSAIVALMTDPVTNKPTGIHRTFLNSDGTKRERKMLGKQGVICLSSDAEVTMALGLVEGIEDGLAVLLSGWGPVWAATSAGAIERFPVLSGIDALTIFADTDEVGMKAACACAARWRDAGAETNISYAKELSRVA